MRKSSSLQDEKFITKLKEVKKCLVKKKSKFIFFIEKEIKMYEDGSIAYFGVRSQELNRLLKPIEM